MTLIDKQNRPLILHIETGGDICSVAVSLGAEQIALEEQTDNRDHASQLSPLIETALNQLNLKYTQLDAVSISMGPGSYTGLRIGLATAKGICYGANVPLIAIDSLLSLSYLHQPTTANTLFCPMIDARRLEVYTCLLDCKRQVIEATQALVLTPDSFDEVLAQYSVVFIGSGAAKFNAIMEHKNAYFPQVNASARGLIVPALAHFQAGNFQNTAYFEPLYLKDFVVTQKKKKE